MSADIASAQRNLNNRQALIAKLKAIRALWISAHNSPTDIEPIAAEFFFVCGDILEGAAPESLPLNHINKKDFLKELRDD